MIRARHTTNRQSFKKVTCPFKRLTRVEPRTAGLAPPSVTPRLPANKTEMVATAVPAIKDGMMYLVLVDAYA